MSVMYFPFARGKLNAPEMFVMPLEYWFSVCRMGFMMSGYRAWYARMMSCEPSVDASSWIRISKRKLHFCERKWSSASLRYGAWL